MNASFPIGYLPIDAGELHAERSLFGPRLMAGLALGLGLLSFLPYPSIPAGSNSAIQGGNIIVLLLSLQLALVSWKRQPYFLVFFLLIPLWVSALKVMATQESMLDVSFKSALACSLVCLTLPVAQLCLPRYLNLIMTGIAVATLLHVAVGLWQAYVFAVGGDLPLQFIYINPSFFSVQESAVSIVRYIRRPFGLFPEPSAMSSSLAPWVLLWAAEVCGLVRFVHQPARWQRILFVAATIAGISLIVMSKSGHAMATVAALVLFALLWVKKAPATPRNVLIILFSFGIVAPLGVWLTYLALSGRIQSESAGRNGSWEDRSNSIILGFRVWTSGSPWTVLFGVGCGRSGQLLWQASGLNAVWSVLLTFVYETGILGALGACWVGQYVFRVWRSAGFTIVFTAIFAIWLLGVTVTTSYMQLLPIWIALALFTVWPRVCQSPLPRFGKDLSGPMRLLRFPGSVQRTPAHAETLTDMSLTPWGRE